MKRVAIVGAGASGLPAIRHALLYGFEPVCFESADDVGGLWRYKPYETDESSVMKSTVINTSKEMTAYSDFPPPEEYANFMHNTQLLKYLKLYAGEFNLLKYIKFHHKVLNVARAPSFDQDGKWTVVYTDAEGVEHKETFDCVLVASGHHTTPYLPSKWPGQDEFTGKVLHSHSYKDHRGFEDKVVVVVGVGNSGGDVAVELSRLAKQVYLVTRRGTWVFNRIYDYGMPFDLSLNTRMKFILRDIVPERISEAYVIARLQKRFDHGVYGLKPKHGVFSAHPTVNDELPNRIACGTVIIKPNIKSFGKNNLIFEDNTCIEHVDTVVLATGFSFEFPIVENGELIKVHDNEVDLYQYMYPLATAKHNTLAILGLIQPLGSIMPISEMQARVFFDVLSGESQLPASHEMRHNMVEKRETMAKRYVDYNVYMDELAELIGCKPDMKALFLSDPVLAYKCLFGPNAPYQYRLRGPHAWTGARNALMALDERVLKPTMTRLAMDSKSSTCCCTSFLTAPILAASIVVIALLMFLF
ncbi:hypothetical protein QR680_003348 [Steinernema hermaphroditum]|uniref:Flavin-containing monooxygenase n=1 Tax=Steinernema hermaphroditum TaxID=289476 RepID=A0AA39H6E4_9BILA|nr:hypothetical protein QR680_003348 [Steinernema hermaphroditum]